MLASTRLQTDIPAITTTTTSLEKMDSRLLRLSLAGTLTMTKQLWRWSLPSRCCARLHKSHLRRHLIQDCIILPLPTVYLLFLGRTPHQQIPYLSLRLLNLKVWKSIPFPFVPKNKGCTRRVLFFSFLVFLLLPLPFFKVTKFPFTGNAPCM